MKAYILILAIGLFSFSTGHAEWTEKEFDIANVDMSISGQVSVDSNGLNLSRATVTAFVPTASAKWNGTLNRVRIAERVFNRPDGTSVSVADLICQKIGKRRLRTHEDDLATFDTIAFLNQDLAVESLISAAGSRVYGDIECM